jgi:plastocyanin
MQTVRVTLLTLAVALAVGACSSNAATSAPSVAVPSIAAPSVAIPSIAIPSVAIPSVAAPAAVTIAGFAFKPATLTIKVGTKVTWTNTDSTAHTVTFDDSSITGSGNIPTGATFDNTFSAAGTFTYHCRIHPAMTGTITVS